MLYGGKHFLQDVTQTDMMKDKEIVVFRGYCRIPPPVSSLTPQPAHPPPPSKNNSILYNSNSVYTHCKRVSVLPLQHESERHGKKGEGEPDVYVCNSVCMYECMNALA